MKAGDHLVLVDGSAFIFRAFHALPPLTRKSDGLPVGAVSGFCNMIWKLLQEGPTPEPGDEPTHFAVIFDYSAKTFRNEIYAEYKAHRPEPPEDLVPQFGLIREATRAFSLPSIEQKGWEADDLIATYARLACEAGARTTIISSDKDLMQLIGPSVIMFDTMRDQLIDAEFVVQKFGVLPEKMIDLQALTGDATDNVPGVPGIGPKTASQLLQEYGDLETLLSRASEIKQNKRRENLIEFSEQARISKRLVTLENDVPLEVPLSELVVEQLDGKRAIAFCRAMEFNTLTRRVAEKTGMDASQIEPAAISVEGRGDGAPAHGPDLAESAPAGDGATAPAASGGPATGLAGERGLLGAPADLVRARAEAAVTPKIDTASYDCVRTVGELEAWIAAAAEAGTVAFDTETTDLDPLKASLCGVSLALAPGNACYVPLGHRRPEAAISAADLFGEPAAPGDASGQEANASAGDSRDEDYTQIGEKEALALLKPMLEDPAILKIGQNLKYDWLLLKARGIEIAPFDDTMLISYALDAGFGQQHGMDTLSERHLGHKPIAYKDVCGTGRDKVTFDQAPIGRATCYAAEDADITLRLWRVLKPRLVAEGLVGVYERLERPLVPVLAKMEERGVKVDRDILSRLSHQFAQKAAGLEAEIFEMAGESFNIGSPKQLGEILFGRLGLPGGRKTKGGQWSTDVKVLEDLAAEGHPLPMKIVAWRQLTKLKGTYTDAIPSYLDERGRVHTSYSLASTTTGRLSSSEPNLQNIPVRTEEGRQIRTAFVAEEGTRLVSADYSQIELRILAHIAEIPALRQAFADGLDIHAMTASEMFSTPIEGMDPMIRRRAKAINFGIIYGISAFGLAAQLGIGREEAGEYIKTYFRRFPGIRDYMEATKEQARDKGYVETLFGRRAHFPNIRHSNHSIRAGAERAAINAPIQGSAADIIRRAMIRMEETLARSRLAARMLLQVHDELIFEVPEEEVEASLPVIRQVMERASEPALELRVPLQVDARAADNWEAAH
ncbi:DNA polymerase I [Afifella sp. IM 167]|uniref:DNA polymerase I n=1 Tax=Afifella sp. IM 167 TaxID=2033586 RepID=UPI001CCD7F5C|nr:DNA polymerase I [Afifella sp. IM 167]MBZ8133546.1 DNA polymerase I [Afifella sp. IM 167]